MRFLISTLNQFAIHMLSVLSLFVLSSVVHADDSIHVQIPENQFVVLAFHDVREDTLTQTAPDPYAMNVATLAHFFDFIQTHHLNPVSLQQILDAKAGKQKLPANSVLLTFDDGPESNFTLLYPLIKQYRYPVLLALETGWITGQVSNDAFGKNGFVTWAQLREMKSSGLVEFATHSHDLHRGILANPQGNLEPAAITRLYDAKTQRYETDDAYQQRIFNDLTLSSQLIKKELGVQPRAVVWPYGAMNAKTREIAASVGLPISFLLGDDQANLIQDNQLPWSRLLILNNPNAVQIEQQISQAISPKISAQRAVQINLDDVYDVDPAQVDLKLGQLLDRIKTLNIRSVYLKAFSDLDQRGVASQLYFPNRHLPMRADLLNRVAWQLRTRAGVQVYAWLPLFGLKSPASGQPSRLNPFYPQSLKIIGDLYEDLGKNTPSLKGVLINDDASNLDHDDSITCPSETYELKTKVLILHCQPLTPEQKALALINVGDAVVARLNRYLNSSSDFSVVRGIDANRLLQAPSDLDVTQAFTPLVAHYDEINLNLDPYWVGDKVPVKSIQTLISRISTIPHALEKVTFNLNTQVNLSAKNPQVEKSISSHLLQGWMQTLQQLGVQNIAYSPDDFQRNQPEFSTVFSGISLNQFPALYKEPQMSLVNDKKAVAP